LLLPRAVRGPPAIPSLEKIEKRRPSSDQLGPWIGPATVAFHDSARKLTHHSIEHPLKVDAYIVPLSRPNTPADVQAAPAQQIVAIAGLSWTAPNVAPRDSTLLMPCSATPPLRHDQRTRATT